MKHLNATSAQVSAIAAGATVLLLPMKPQPEMATPLSKIHRVDDGELLHERWPLQDRSFNNFGRCERLKAKPPFLPGQRVGVRERWAIRDCGKNVSLIDEVWPNGWPVSRLVFNTHPQNWNTRPARSMPDWAIRTWLNITACDPVKEEDVWKWQVRFTVEGR